jgi:hypothetical protein
MLQFIRSAAISILT